jgi:acyl carrier protein
MSVLADEVRLIVAQVLEKDENIIKNDDDIYVTHHAESIEAFSIIARLQKKYNIQIGDDEIPKMTTINKIATFIECELAKN